MALRLILAFLLLWTTTTGTAKPAMRQPVAKWIVDFDDAQCVATRKFGSAAEPLLLFFKAPPLGGVMQIGVMRNGSYAPADQVNATIGIGDEAPIKTNMMMFSPKRGGTRIYLLNMPSERFSLVRTAPSLTIRSSGLNETFALSNLEPLLNVMAQCVADLRHVWNVVDQQGEKSPLSVRAKTNLTRLVTDEDYPALAISNDLSGPVRFALLIDEAGQVADCTVIETSGVAALDSQTCAIIKKRAKFEPARTADGKPAKDAFISRLTWKLAY